MESGSLVEEQHSDQQSVLGQMTALPYMLGLPVLNLLWEAIEVELEDSLWSLELEECQWQTSPL